MGLDSDMQYQTRQHKRGSTYYFRVKIPVDLRRHYDGRQEIKYSLGTKDHREAARLVRQHSARLDQEFEALRGASQGLVPPAQRKRVVPDPSTISALCDHWRYLTLDGDAWSRCQGLSESEYEDHLAQRQATQEALRTLLARGQSEKVYPALKIYLDLLGLDIRPEGEGFRNLAYAFLQTAVQTTADLLRRDAGEVVQTPEPVGLPFAATVSGSTTHITLVELLTDWEKAVANRPESTVRAFRYAVQEFHAFLGVVKPAAELVRQDFLRYRDHLLGTVMQAPKTIQKKLNLLGAILQLAVDNERIGSNPVSRVSVKNGKKAQTPRVPYSAEDMQRIYRSPLFTDGERPRGGGGEAAVWLPVLAPLTGARLEELAQLRTWDIKCDGGIWYIDIVEDDGEFPTTLKTPRFRAASAYPPAADRHGLPALCRSHPEDQPWPPFPGYQAHEKRQGQRELEQVVGPLCPIK